jgi:molecular chaperone GrpE
MTKKRKQTRDTDDARARGAGGGVTAETDAEARVADPAFAHAASAEEDHTPEVEEDHGRATSAEMDELSDRLLRLHAEFDNYRRRTRRDLETARQEGMVHLIRQLLPVLRDLERAQTAAAVDATEAQLKDGVQLVLRGFQDALAREGVEEIDPVGEAFDEQFMEAIGLIPSQDVAEGCVAEVFQKGHRVGDRLIDPARVLVSSGLPGRDDAPATEGAP